MKYALRFFMFYGIALSNLSSYVPKFSLNKTAFTHSLENPNTQQVFAFLETPTTLRKMKFENYLDH